jgi:hypothetical protein
MERQEEREVIGGRYAVDQQIGAGGAGSVFLAYDTALGRWVAVKRMPAGDDAVLREAMVLAGFQHANIVTVHDVVADGGEVFIVMEFVQGRTLEDLEAPLDEATFRNIAAQCLEGLGAAHAQGVLHRDIKPGNIMLSQSPAGVLLVKILDFGQSRDLASPSRQTLDQNGAMMGSIFMMSPEQLRHEELDCRTDFYSLGCVFFQTLTLQQPFTGETVPQVVAAHLEHRHEPLGALRPDLPADLVKWVERLFSFEKDARPSTAEEALQGLKATVATEKIRVLSKGPSGPVLKPRRLVELPENPYLAGMSKTASIPVPVAAVAAAPIRLASPVPTEPVTPAIPVAVPVVPVADMAVPVVALPIDPEPVAMAVPVVVAAAAGEAPVRVTAAVPAGPALPAHSRAPAVAAGSVFPEFPGESNSAPSKGWGLTHRVRIAILAGAAVLLLIGGGIAGYLAWDGGKTRHQTPPTNEELAGSLAFPTTVLSISRSSITFLDADEKTKMTLPIDGRTYFKGFQSVDQIQPQSRIGIRLDARKTRVLILNLSMN